MFGAMRSKVNSKTALAGALAAGVAAKQLHAQLSAAAPPMQPLAAKVSLAATAAGEVARHSAEVAQQAGQQAGHQAGQAAQASARMARSITTDDLRAHASLMATASGAAAIVEGAGVAKELAARAVLATKRRGGAGRAGPVLEEEHLVTAPDDAASPPSSPSSSSSSPRAQAARARGLRAGAAAAQMRTGLTASLRRARGSVKSTTRKAAKLFRKTRRSGARFFARGPWNPSTSPKWTVQRVLSSSSVCESETGTGSRTEDFFELFSEEELEELASEDAREFEFDSPVCRRELDTRFEASTEIRQPVFDDVSIEKPALPFPLRPSMGTWLMPLPPVAA